jgi:hypothetical protein
MGWDVLCWLGHRRFARHLSLSRLNHRLPWREANTEVVQSTADFHHDITDTLLPQTDPVFDDATAFDTAVDMLDAQPTVVQRLIRRLLFPRQLLAAGFLVGMRISTWGNVKIPAASGGALEGRSLLCWGNLSPKPPNKDAIPPHRKQWGILASFRGCISTTDTIWKNT